MNPTLEQWLREHRRLEEACEEASAASEQAREEAEAEAPLAAGWTRLPFVNSKQKEAIRRARQYYQKCLSYEEELLQSLEELSEGLDQYTLNAMEDQEDEALMHGRSILQYFKAAERRMTRSLGPVDELIQAIGGVRAAMGVGYNSAKQVFSPAALAAFQEGVESAQELSKMLQRVERLNEEFSLAVRSSHYEALGLPELEVADYELLLVDAARQPLSLAHAAVEQMLSSAKRLRDEVIPRALQTLRWVEEQHEALTQELARMCWQDWQQDLFHKRPRIARQSEAVPS